MHRIHETHENRPTIRPTISGDLTHAFNKPTDDGGGGEAGLLRRAILCLTPGDRMNNNDKNKETTLMTVAWHIAYAPVSVPGWALR